MEKQSRASTHKKLGIMAALLTLILMLLAACGEATPPVNEATPAITPTQALPTELPQPTVVPTPEEIVTPTLVGTWHYLTTTLGDEDNLHIDPIIFSSDIHYDKHYGLPSLEIYEDNTIYRVTQESDIKAVFTQAEHNQNNQYEFLVTELSQKYEDGSEWFQPEFSIALSYDAGNGLLRWTFLEGGGYITNVNQYYILSYESMDKEVNIIVDDYDVIVDEEHGMNWAQYTLPRLAVYSHYMDGAYAEGTSREWCKRFMEMPHIVLPYIALIGDETFRDDCPTPNTREILCSNIIYGGDFSQNPSEPFLEILDMYDEIYTSGSVADVITLLREKISEIEK